LAAASSAAAAMAPQQIAGLSFDAHSPTSLLAYVATTVVVNSVFPLPLAGPLLTVAVVLYGVVPGFVLNLCAAVVGCCLTLVLTRSCLRPHFIRLLGEHAEVWHSLDGAIVEQGAMIPLLFRLTPAAPVVLANVVLSLTSVDAWTYAWTVFIGFIPSGIPFAYAAVVGEAVINEFPPKDPVLLSVTLLGLVATVLAVWQVGVLAASEMRKAGVRLPFGEQQLDSREMV